jgi:peroxiredoxin Q/BCP
MISEDTPDVNKAFAEQEHADFPMLSDPTHTVATAYGVLYPPSPAQPDLPPMAKRWTFYIGPDGKIEAIDTKPGTSTAGQAIIAKLKELGVKEK